MPYSVQRGIELPDQSPNYAGFTLESAKNAYVKEELEQEDFEMLVELILLEQESPQEKKFAGKRMEIVNGQMKELTQYERPLAVGSSNWYFDGLSWVPIRAMNASW